MQENGDDHDDDAASQALVRSHFAWFLFAQSCRPAAVPLGTMEIITLSGVSLTQICEEELGCMVESGAFVEDLKKLLAARLGYSRFRQRLFSEDAGELLDDMPVRQLPSVQLVILDFCAPEETVWEALLLACKENQVDEVTRLLQKPLDPNVDNDAPPLYFATEAGHLKVVQLLLEAGADKNVAVEDGVTALMLAAYKGHLEVVRLLLEAGADKNTVDAHGATARMHAFEMGHSEVAWLLEAGDESFSGSGCRE